MVDATDASGTFNAFAVTAQNHSLFLPVNVWTQPMNYYSPPTGVDSVGSVMVKPPN
jgi:hypothetical protein